LDVICANFKNFDQNNDRQVEIQELRPIATAGKADRRVLMLVEQRVLDAQSGAANLKPALARWAQDVSADGYCADVIAVKLAPSKLHQDGRYVLALREFLRATNRETKLAGVVLVGHFPDAFLVRTCNWRRHGDITLHYKSPKQKSYKAAIYLQRKPEAIADCADIVLSDLDGRWEDVYVQPKTGIELVKAVFAEKIPPNGGPCIDVEKSSKAFEDMFHISDGSLEVGDAAVFGGDVPQPYVNISNDDTNHECAEADRDRPNIMCRPDIFVSRVDARGIALRAKASIVGKDKAKLLDAQGKPQAVKFASARAVPSKSDDILEADPIFERRLLAEYFDRNHDYRTGQAKIAWRPASIACDLGSGYRSMQRAATNWEPGDPKRADVRGKPTLVDFVNWIEYPAILRTVRAHSNPIQSQFRKTDIAKVHERLGGPVWSWSKKGDSLEPSLQSTCGNGMLSWSLLNSLYQNGQIPPEPCFYQHGGCDAVSPAGAATLPYNHPLYGKRQCAQSLLMFGNGLALIGRAKVYYDEPAGFTTALRKGETFGNAWARYYELESQGVSSKGAGEIGRKRAYFWSVLGDWTLKLSTAAPKSVASLPVK